MPKYGSSQPLRNKLVVLTFFMLLVMLTTVCLGLMRYKEHKRKAMTLTVKRTRFPRDLSSNNSVTTTKSSKSNEDDDKKKDEYPDDVFTLEQKQNGAVVLHVFGLCYMFLALATVSDEFFIPSLEVITSELGVSEDVAGATFMAAGGSAPELFTSVIGVFIANSNVGFGTIVGSAVFNVLFVIGMCAVFSKGVLQLTWWPLFRDCIFYIIALVLLIVYFIIGRQGNRSMIHWWQAVTMIVWYFAYALFMKYNVEIERFVKKFCSGTNRIGDGDLAVISSWTSSRETDAYVKKALEYMKNNGKEKPCFRFGALQLIMRTIDPLREVSVCDLAKEMESMNRQRNASKGNSNFASLHVDQLSEVSESRPNSPTSMPSADNVRLHTLSMVTTSTQAITDSGDEQYRQISHQGSYHNDVHTAEIHTPLVLSFPKGFKDRLVFIIRAPILFFLHVTLSDVRKPEKRRRYPWTFFISILWIVVFSYFMVWWAREISLTFEIDDEIMGLTVLAAGTSIPDLITSVLVARKGYGDMAVSSSVGSNLFDVTIGLPLPWLIWSIMHSGNAFGVVNSGLFCSTILLFGMLLTVVVSIALCKWRMSKTLGILMLMLYVVFVVLSVLLQKDVFVCDF